MLPLVILCNLGTLFLFNGTDWFLAQWTDSEERKQFNETNAKQNFADNFDRNGNIYIYSGAVALLFISLIRTTTFFTASMRSSIKLHNRLFSSVIRSKIVFFDTTPIGNLLNRCSRDMGIVDDLLPASAFDAIEIVGNTVGVVVLVAIIDVWTLVPFVFLVIFFCVYCQILHRNCEEHQESGRHHSKSSLQSYVY